MATPAITLPLPPCHAATLRLSDTAAAAALSLIRFVTLLPPDERRYVILRHNIRQAH